MYFSSAISELVIFVSVVDYLYLFPFIISLDFFICCNCFQLSLCFCLMNFGQVYVFQQLLKLWPIVWFQLDQLLHEGSVFTHLIALSDRVHPPCNRDISVFLPYRTQLFSSFQKGHISFLLHLLYFPLFYICHKILRKWDGFCRQFGHLGSF